MRNRNILWWISKRNLCEKDSKVIKCLKCNRVQQFSSQCKIASRLQKEYKLRLEKSLNFKIAFWLLEEIFQQESDGFVMIRELHAVPQVIKRVIERSQEHFKQT